MKHPFLGALFEIKKTFLFNLMLMERVEVHALMLIPCVKGSEVKMPPICLFLKPPIFTYLHSTKKNIFTV